MKQNILQKLMLIAATLLTGSHALASDFTADGINYYILSESEKTVEVDKGYGNGYSDKIEIPENVTYNNTTYSVVSIGEGAFEDCENLTSVTIPKSITDINHFAFEGCSLLTEIKVNEDNTVFDSRNNCNAIIETATNTIVVGCKSTVFPSTVTCINTYAFHRISTLTHLEIPDNITNISGGAFAGSGLTSIIVKDGNPNYDSRDNCNAIIETATNSLIVGCKNTTIPNTVTSLGIGAFYECRGLTSLAIPNNITTIGGSAFDGCEDLVTIELPDGITNIEDWTFSGCSSLISITLPKTVTNIGYRAFYGCESLKEIYCKPTTPPTFLDLDSYHDSFNDYILQNTYLYVPKGSKNAYETVEPWSKFRYIIEKDFSSIESTFVNDDIRVCVVNGKISVNGTDNAIVEVYNLNGKCVYSGNDTTIPVTTNGMYIVKVGNKPYKVVL